LCDKNIVLAEISNLQIEVEAMLETKTFSLSNLANLVILIEFN